MLRSRDLVALPLLVATSLAHAQPEATEPPIYEQRRSGFTFELDAGGGYLTSDYASNGAGGVVLGLGYWLSMKTAIVGRYTMALTANGDDLVLAGLVGPDVQHYLGKRLWLGGGIGYAFAVRDNSVDQMRNDGVAGFGLGVRAGISTSPGRNDDRHVGDWYMVGRLSLNLNLGPFTDSPTLTAIVAAGFQVL